MPDSLFVTIHRKKAYQAVGNKAENLQQLQGHGMRVPITHVLPWTAYQRYLANDLTVIEEIQTALRQIINPAKRYAVRSSTNLEDNVDHSFAGQFKSVLNVAGADSIFQAIWSVWATANNSQVGLYLQQRMKNQHDLQMAVIVQEMVEPVVSGVAFSVNPVTGLDEVVIECICGPGTLLVQDGVTPYRWIYKYGKVTQQPQVSPLPLTMVQDVYNSTLTLAKKEKKPVDLEWVWDGQTVYWVQMRQITSVSSINIYSNKISREVMPGIIKPLIWSINVPLVNGAWVKLLTEMIGKNNLDPMMLAKSFYYRSYFNMGVLGEVFKQLGMPGESLEMLSGIETTGLAGEMPKRRFKPGLKTLWLLPRMLGFVWSKYQSERVLSGIFKSFETRYRAIMQEVDRAGEGRTSPRDLIQKIDQLYAITQEAAYFNIIVPIMMNIYNALLRSQLKRVGIEFTAIDMQRDTPEFQQYDPVYALGGLSALFKLLDSNIQDAARSLTFDQFTQMAGAGEFSQALETFLDNYGHISDSGNDFSSVPWHENKELVFQLIREYDRERANADGRANKIIIDQVAAPFMQRKMLLKLYAKARKYSLYREQISYIYTYGYGIFRIYFTELGRYLAERGCLENAHDIFYLEMQEIRTAIQDLERNTAVQDLQLLVDQRKREIESFRSIQLPTVIYGDTAPPVVNFTGSKLIGVPASRGYFNGCVKTVSGFQDFHKVETGDVLVIPFSDVGWTPLFARAGGVIAESGGLLSHSAIVAREYGIPAVVSVEGAMQLKDGTRVTIDGFQGFVLIHDLPQVQQMAADSAAKKGG
jgi:phosphohistidine swiveling domain-containing protein